MIGDAANIGIAAALAAGAISFLSLCVLPLVPGYVSSIAGSSARSPRLNALLLSFFFVLGFSTVFVVLGATASALSRVLPSFRTEAGIVGGAVVTLFGIFMTGLVPLALLQRDIRYHGALQGGRPPGAYLLGLAFAFGWTPCIGPVLGTILMVSAVSATAASGVVLLGVYSIGLGIPFMLAALFTEGLMGRLKKTRRAGRILQVAAGGIMIAMGVAMMTGWMTVFALWLLEQVPAFGRIG